MSDPSLSDIDIKNKMSWTTLKPVHVSDILGTDNTAVGQNGAI